MKTTKTDFELFKKRCLEWQIKLGLTNWALYFQHVHVKDSYARTYWRTTDMAATIQFSLNWDGLRPRSEREVNRLALHEVAHVLLAPLVSEAEYRYSSQESIDAAEHSIVRTLENAITELTHA